MRYTISLLLASLTALPAARAEVPAIIADIPPVQSLAAMVMGDLGTPGLLLDRGANAHDFQLRPSQTAALADADLVIWIGPEMTPWLSRTLDAAGAGAARLGLLDLPETETRAYSEAGVHDHAGEAGHDHGEAEAEVEAGHDHGHEHDHEDAGHSHEGTDPHAWLDPANAAAWVAAIAAELSRLDPANAATYAANAAAATTGIAAMDGQVAAALAPVRDRPFAVFHDAYGYFAAHYGLTIAGSVALGDAADPGAAHLRDLQAGLGEGAAVCIFPEANHDPKIVAAVAEGTGVRIGGALDPEGASLDPGPALYGALMTGLADTLAACLAGE